MKTGKPGHPVMVEEREGCQEWSVFGADGLPIFKWQAGNIVWVYWHGGGEEQQPVYWDQASETYSVDCERGTPVPFVLVEITGETGLAKVCIR